MERYFLESEFPPASNTTANTGVNNAALSATTTSNSIPTKGATQVVLEFDVVGDAGGARTVVFYVDSQRDTDASTLWRQEMVGSDAAPGGGEIVTSLYRRKYSFTTAAAATTQSFTIPLPALYHRIRVSGLTAAGAVAANVVSLHVRVRA